MVVNLTASDGHPIEIMDLTFAIQALCAYRLANEHASMENKVHLLPREIDDEVATMKLDAVGSWPTGASEGRFRRPRNLRCCRSGDVMFTPYGLQDVLN
jgi:S-adenosylhomocysteine hydrolase